jgi:hypothetical protein
VSTSTFSPPSAVLADFNRDGKPDIAVAAQDGVDVSLAGKNGLFQNPVSYGTSSSAIAVGFLKGDSIPDLISLTGNSIGVLLGNGDGTFQDQVTYAANADFFTLGDFNGDGKLDVAVLSPSGITVYLGNGDGTLGQTFTSGAGGSAGPMAAADFNGDNKLDLALFNQTGGVMVLLGNGDGTFGLPMTYFTTISPTALVAADLNADGKIDLIMPAGFYNEALYVALGNGDGTFKSPVSYDSGGVAYTVAVADFNGDGKLDVVVANPDLYPRGDRFAGNLGVLLGNGDGTFKKVTTYFEGTWPGWVGALDLNSDGAPDLVSVNTIDFSPPRSLTVFLNLGGTLLDLKSSANPSLVGELVTFTTTVRTSVRGPNQPTPAGTVTFHEGKDVLGTVKLTKGKAQFTTSKLSIGTHSISAHYSGNNNFNPHTSAVLKQVVKK